MLCCLENDCWEEERIYMDYVAGASFPYRDHRLSRFEVFTSYLKVIIDKL